MQNCQAEEQPVLLFGEKLLGSLPKPAKFDLTPYAPKSFRTIAGSLVKQTVRDASYPQHDYVKSSGFISNARVEH